jgi:hypothetical protein
MAAELIEHAVSSQADLRVLVTSRRPLPRADATLTLGALSLDAAESLLARYGISGSAGFDLAVALKGPAARKLR